MTRYIPRIDRVPPNILRIAIGRTYDVDYPQKHAAVVFNRKGRIVCVGRNTQRPLRYTERGPGVGRGGHAEIMALTRRRLYHIHTLMLLVIRFNDQQFKNSLPCSLCRNIIESLGIPKVYYSIGDDNEYPYSR